MTTPDPPKWVRVVPAPRPVVNPKAYCDSVLTGQVVPVVERDAGSIDPAIYVLDENGKEHRLWDNQWEPV